MKYINQKSVEDLKIAYIGGGSQGWAWGLMSDLAAADDISGKVALYDIDFEAAKKNEIIGNKFNDIPESKSHWDYYAVETLEEALTDADFVVISILPGTFDEMHSDVHTPEKYGIWQPVGDSTGPGGIIRALRTIPMMEVIARGVEKCCPHAWVINYTNPMALCVRAMYDTFPRIKCFGCCHEVFSTKKLLADMLYELRGIEGVTREDVKVNVLGVNHFTWINEATWHGMDLMLIFKEFCDGYVGKDYEGSKDNNWMNKAFMGGCKIKFELFRRFSYIAAAGDRHLAEFCNRKWFLSNPEQVKKFGFALTTVDSRRNMQKERLEQGEKYLSGEENVKITPTGEEGVLQIRALLGLTELITNVNLPNEGQIPNLPLGAVVETNAIFRDGCLKPVFAGNIPEEIEPLIHRNAVAQLQVAKAARERDIGQAFVPFVNDPLMDLSTADAKALFEEMIENTKAYLTEYFPDTKA